VGAQFDLVAEPRRRQKTRPGIDERQPGNAKGCRQIGRLHAERGLEQHPGAPIEKFEKAAVKDDAGGVAMAPLNGKAPPVDEFCHLTMIAAERHGGQPRGQ
jgi:hypothetical protein